MQHGARQYSLETETIASGPEAVTLEILESTHTTKLNEVRGRI
jgi:hypothetical protein